MSKLKPIRYAAEGPAQGLERWPEIAADSLLTPAPVEHGHEYYADAGGQLTSGIWTCTPFESRIEPYSVDEFMQLLEGAVTLVYADGSEDSFAAGECFVIPKGTVCGWRQPGFVRKFYVIFDNGEPAQPRDAARGIRLAPDAELPEVTRQDPARFAGEMPRTRQWNAYADPSGQWQAGIWQASAFELVPASIRRSEFACMLDGEAEIVDGEGEIFACRRGDSFLVPRGMGYQWRQRGTVRKIFCSFTPA